MRFLDQFGRTEKARTRSSETTPSCEVVPQKVLFTDEKYIQKTIEIVSSGGFRVVPRVPWNPSFMKVLIYTVL